MGNWIFQNAPFANGHFLNGGYSCLWAESAMDPSLLLEQNSYQMGQFCMEFNLWSIVQWCEHRAGQLMCTAHHGHVHATNSGGQVRDKNFIDDPEKNAFCQSKAKSICSVLSKMQIGQTSSLLLPCYVSLKLLYINRLHYLLQCLFYSRVYIGLFLSVS